jgi:transcriptional regulator with XRE-family HTH domain
MSSAIAVRLQEIISKAGVTAKEVSKLLNTTPETVSRWNTGKTEPQPSSRDEILRLEWLAGQLAELYPPQEARLWLFSPHKQLKGESPADTIANGRMEDVLRIIAQLKDGAFI